MSKGIRWSVRIQHDSATSEQAFQQNVGSEAFRVVQPNHESGRDNMETFQGIQHVPELCR